MDLFFYDIAAVFFIGILIVWVFEKRIRYSRSSYFRMTGEAYSAIRSNAGKYGEYKTYEKLKFFEKSGGKFLFNIYAPKPDGKTSEIDVLLIYPKGIFVFESKNFGGWIFGNEKQKYWVQTFPRGRGRSHKESFYNPVWQNDGHIRCLKKLIGDNIPMHSVVVFSGKCVLKNVTVERKDVRVAHLWNVAPTVQSICSGTEKNVLSPEDIDRVFLALLPHTMASPDLKNQHAEYAGKQRF